MDDEINICSELWDDLGNNPSLIFRKTITSGSRFRYDSEIEKKSFSFMKSEDNKWPIIEVKTTADEADLQIELMISDEDSREKLHFNTLYQVGVEKQAVQKETLVFKLSESGNHFIELQNTGIRKMKSKEAMLKIKKLYPELNESKAKKFYNDHKDLVKVKVTLFQYELPALYIYSEPIKSQTSKEHKTINIKYFAPKVVADASEQLIIILTKKITTDDYEACLIIQEKTIPLYCVDSDGQTFIYNLPSIICENPIEAKFKMKCGKSEDIGSIRFLTPLMESRKRKADTKPFSPALKRSNTLKSIDNTHYEPIPLLPESGQLMDEIQTDSASLMDTDIHYNNNMINLGHDVRIFDNESYTDSGFHTKSDIGSSDEGNDLVSEYESGDDFIVIDGFRRRNGVKQSYGPITVSAKRRDDESYLDMDVSNNATKKILSEVARIGHDYAFGKKPSDVFDRIVNQLPVVFTLQDDVGDTPLNNAILKGNVDNAFKILDIVKTHCYWALDLVNTSGHSALILAPACEVPPEFIKQLLKAGCRLDMWDDTGKSAIVYAIEYQNIKALEVLLQHVKETKIPQVLSRYKSSYYSPLQLTILNDFKEGMNMLLQLKDKEGKYMVDINEVAQMNGETALHMAVTRSSDLSVINSLLQRPDIEINQCTKDNATALSIARKKKLNAIVEILQTHHADDEFASSDVDNVEESDNDMDDCELTDLTLIQSDSHQMIDNESTEEKVPVLEDVRLNSNGINTLTSSMMNLTIKGERKKELINILITSEGPTISINELKSLVKPTFQIMFTKYGNTDEHKRDISEMLDRLNCLPSSLGQLVDNLDYLGRTDLIAKIQDRLEVLSNC